MSKNLQYVRVLELLQSAKGPVKVSDVKALDGIVPTRLSTYLWEIKKNTGFAVKSNRDGRAVVSYELVGSGIVPSPKVVQVSKVATAKTTTKATTKATAKPAPPPAACSAPTACCCAACRTTPCSRLWTSSY